MNLVGLDGASGYGLASACEDYILLRFSDALGFLRRGPLTARGLESNADMFTAWRPEMQSAKLRDRNCSLVAMQRGLDCGGTERCLVYGSMPLTWKLEILDPSPKQLNPQLNTRNPRPKLEAVPQESGTEGT